MGGNRATPSRLATLLAAAVVASFAGCESEDSAPRTAAGADREVLGAATSLDATHHAKRDDGQASIAAVAPPAQPVTALKPKQVEPGVALASAKMVAAVSDAGREAKSASVDAAPRLADAPEDASKYPGGIIPASLNAQPLPGGPRLLVPNKTFRSVGDPPALQVSYDDLDLLKVLNVDPVPTDIVEQFPDWLRDLDGQRIRIRGFMYPAYEEMLSSFVLTRDTGECCFGPKAKVYYLIGVKLKDGAKVRYVQNRPIDVEGTFHIQPVVSDGQWFQLYKITDAAVVD